MEIIAALISSLIGGIVVAYFNHLLTQQKTSAEVRHLEAETELLHLQIKQLQQELQDVKTKILERIETGSGKTITMTEETRRILGDFGNDS